ncbi:MAG TPA: C2H2-type zinc finger protein [Nitrososphaerales archaeon]|nr:C2H2-type zinc finger protein [Nitrososphaerales archaeon]
MAGFKCEACGMEFPTKEALMEHGAAVHKMPSPSNQFICKACGATFDSTTALQEHAKKAHAM